MRALSDTIVAVATAPGNGAIGVLRLSGAEAIAILTAVFRPARAKAALSQARLVRGTIVDPASGRALDDVLAAAFYAPHSYTGQDAAEIHAHGGALNLRELLALLIRQGARAAEPGEFTLRAFLNDRVDLTAAQGVQALIAAQSDLALRAARRHLLGDFGRFLTEARQGLIEALAAIEAGLDFPDEGLVPEEARAVAARLGALQSALAEAADSRARARWLSDGVDVMVVGAPNVGKSSLLNRLLRREAVITSPEPGTTRDLIEVSTTIAGLPVRLVDGAGLRDTEQAVEALGIAKLRERLPHSDLLLWVLDASHPYTASESALARSFGEARVICVLNKGDLPRAIADADLDALPPEWPRVTISALSGAGISELESLIAHRFGDPASGADALLVTDARQAEALHTAAGACARVQEALARGAEIRFELLACDLREALDALDDLLGLRTSDEILNAIFSRFCIGK